MEGRPRPEALNLDASGAAPRTPPSSKPECLSCGGLGCGICQPKARVGGGAPKNKRRGSHGSIRSSPDSDALPTRTQLLAGFTAAYSGTTPMEDVDDLGIASMTSLASEGTPIAMMKRSDSDTSIFDKIESVPTSSTAAKGRLRGRRNSMDMWNTPDQTIIIFDWDDTLMPTTWLEQDLKIFGPPPRSAVNVWALLSMLTQLALDTLKIALTVAARVLIVTLAEPPWVANSITDYFPELRGKLEELGVQVVYARNILAKNIGGAYNKQDFKDDEEKELFWMGVKAKAIAQQCGDFYSQYEGQSWKNVISIGDSDFELVGAEAAVREWVKENKDTAQNLPRIKTLKLLDDPTAEELIDQLKALHALLPMLVARDGVVSLDFETIGTKQKSLGEIDAMLRDGGVASEPPDESLIQGRLWRLGANADPHNENAWIPRRVWLSRTGRLWYESLKAVKPVEFFSGIKVSHLKVSCLTPGGDSAAQAAGGQRIFPMRFEAAKYKVPPSFLAAESAELREQWLVALRSFASGQ